MTTINSALFNPTDLVLELDSKLVDRAWTQSSGNSGNAASRWQSYLNRVALNTVLPWLQSEEDSSAKLSWGKAAQGDIWEVVNGAALTLGTTKLVLIPSEAEDLSELRVPQEWIDIPEWVADYYLPIQVNLDAGYVRLWGYTTHQKLKQSGEFSYSDRTYSLSEDELIADINALWVARELCPDEVTQAAVEPVAELAAAQAENLITRLGSQSQLLPRLAVPFATWGALLKNPNWRQRLSATRRGATPKTPLWQWFNQSVANISSEFGWRKIEMSLSTQGARGAATADTTAVPTFGLAKKIAIASQPYELKILPLEEAGSWRFELSCLTPGCLIPAGVTLRLLTEDLQGFEGNENIATEPVSNLALEVDLDSGESLVWQVEPTPDDYQLEVLQF